MEDETLREDLVELVAAQSEEHATQQEALRKHEEVNDRLVDMLRDLHDRVERLEQHTGCTFDQSKPSSS